MGLIRGLSNMNTGWISLIRGDLSLLSHSPDLGHFANLSLIEALNLIEQDPRYHHNKFRKTLQLPYYSIHADELVRREGDPIPPGIHSPWQSWLGGGPNTQNGFGL